jgi:hypothetical protein
MRHRHLESLLTARYFYDALANIFSKSTTTSSVAFSVDLDGGRKTVFSLGPIRSDAKNGLYFEIYVQRMLQHLGIGRDELMDTLPLIKKPFTKFAAPDYTGFEGYFPDRVSVDKFLALFVPRNNLRE